MKVAEGDLDACIWFCGDTWDHAAPSVIVKEASGRFSDHLGGSRLDARTGVLKQPLPQSNSRLFIKVSTLMVNNRFGPNT